MASFALEPSRSILGNPQTPTRGFTTLGGKKITIPSTGKALAAKKLAEHAAKKAASASTSSSALLAQEIDRLRMWLDQANAACAVADEVHEEYETEVDAGTLSRSWADRLSKCLDQLVGVKEMPNASMGLAFAERTLVSFAKSAKRELATNITWTQCRLAHLSLLVEEPPPPPPPPSRVESGDEDALCPAFEHLLCTAKPDAVSRALGFYNAVAFGDFQGAPPAPARDDDAGYDAEDDDESWQFGPVSA